MGIVNREKIRKMIMKRSASIGTIVAAVLLTGACTQKPATPPQTLSEAPVSVVQPSQEAVSTVPAIKINDCKIKLEELHGNTEKSQPDVTISYRNKTLVEGTDYVVSAEEESSSVGKHELTITMRGDYEGSQKVPYIVVPDSPVLTACSTKVTTASLEWTAVKDVDGYELEYVPADQKKPARIARVGKDTLSCELQGLLENRTYRFRVRSFKVVDGYSEYSAWSDPTEKALTKIKTVNGATYVDDILIVNKTYPLPADYGYGEDPEALDAFYRMQADAAAENIWIGIISGYRSYSVQSVTYQSFVYDRGQYEADRVSARPGHSEHQTGLAFDINSTAFAFADTPEAKWLARNCSQYGFIIRYPEGKESVTGYQYESWHIRYLGVEKAQKITASGLTLEEYYGLSSRYAD